MRLKRKQILEREKKDKKENSVWEWAKTIAFSIVLGLAITTFIRPVLVDGMSMYPTLSNYDYLIMNRVPYIMEEPKFGDIIVCKSSLRTLDGDEKDLVKRVIGLSGDKIEISGGKVYINGEELSENYIAGGITTGEVPLQVIKDGYVFVMGDNRPNSSDSRSDEVGQVPISDIKGKIVVRLFPFDKIGVVE